MVRAFDVLGPQSPLSRALPGWELREGQLAMAEAVERALARERHLFVEAGTGTGKTLAYLVPAVLSRRKVIVSTATRALQEQIFVHDLPLVAEALAVHGVQFRASLMKGLSNYVCLRRFEEARQSGAHSNDLAFRRLSNWLQGTESGDRAELADLPEDAPAWREVSSSSDTRIGAGCDHFERCFVTRMRREAEDAEIVVVNHHLFLADLALRTGPRGAHASVLPAYDAVVFDEAHQIEDIATEFFGVRISSARVDALVRDAERSLGAVQALEVFKSGANRALLEAVRETGRAFFATLAAGSLPGDARRVLADVPGELRHAHAALDRALEALEGLARSRREEAMLLLARRAAELREDLATVLADPRPPTAPPPRPEPAFDEPFDEQQEPQEDPPSAAPGLGPSPERVRWVDVRARSVALGASPVDASATLRARLFDRVPTVICTSATLATAGNFSFARARLGAPEDTLELFVDSPFDFGARAALYLANDLPDPADPAFEEAAAERICALIAMTGGGAFVLCTSIRSMQSLHARLRTRLDLPLFVQGERPKHVLLSRFRSSGNAVLVATMSFWEGVDVPGWALRLVILEKIPFAPPNDPVVAARCARIDRQGGSGFVQYSVPSAAMTLKQGFGRLIRTQRDAGIVALLDRRIVRRGYGRILLGSLPPARRVRDLEELRLFWARIASEMRSSPPGEAALADPRNP